MREMGIRMSSACAMAVGTIALAVAVSAQGQTADPEVRMEQKIRGYFENRFADLKAVADQQPTADTFRKAMKPLVEKTEGVFGGTLIDPDFVIQEVYFKRDFLARGYDLKKVEQLVEFAREMKEEPAPQLSEPGHGNLVQPRLVAMRYPFMRDGNLAGIVSIMIRTEAFLKEVGLDKVKAFQIICRGKPAESVGKLSATPHKVTLALPSTQWEILFDEGE